ncbi:hemolysin III family protein [Fusobacterium sp. MFO224]|uniref:PAQR family membrane homeostasis protein TrhA n=1 Tax=Fusobacterium sp. MFO224 TaxID=3378070 RepID=UPI00385243AD
MKQTLEEYLNAISHYIGAGLSVVALVLMIVKSSKTLETGYTLGCVVFGLALIFLYSMSGTYHILKKGKVKNIFRVLDHVAIYVLISASYTPYIFTVLHGKTRWIVFGVQWGLTLFGIIFKIFFTGRFKVVSTLIYLFMGWMVMFVFKDIKLSLSSISLDFLVTGGIIYSVGALFYMMKKLKFSHCIWHIFVIGGSLFNFLSIYYIV